MISYELHTLKKGAHIKEWALDAVFEDRELAIHEASIMDNSDRYAGLRVIAERQDPATGKIETTTVFRGGSNFREAKNRAIEGTAGAGRRLPPEARDFTPRPRVRQPVERRSVTSLVPVLLLFLLLGVGAMYALHELAP